MLVKWSDRFKKCFDVMSKEAKKVSERKLALFADNPRHPSLRSKRVQGTNSIWESTVNKSTRFTWEYIEGGVKLRAIGEHDKVLSNP
ncbi:MAG: hypothetical protein KJ907_11430 [Actinobacteria bacterium]|nr:hypothetical protein [Actinomycetota bacterium]MBU4390874.1 hypothetical protein [Actinomycetota bacterium]MBU4403329.1 hypothetical protein [Actinomycetota bacterium]MBU4441882.1 hypothetical protein [Actinomycetota bacterium]MCG2817947.1 hypothetical protein [Actinomycetes bacterium]